MKKIYLLLCVVVALSACSNDDQDGVNDGVLTEDYSYFKGAALNVKQDSIGFIVSIDSGAKLAFEYQRYSDPIANLADNESRTTIIFEIDPQRTDFSFKDDQLVAITPYHRVICYCGDTNSVAIEKGTISGKKLNNDTYRINIDVEVLRNGQLLTENLSGNFRLKR